MIKDISDQKDKKIIARGRLDGNQRKRLVNLMNMMYSPSELADEKRFIWINGVEFRNWIKEIYKKRELFAE